MATLNLDVLYRDRGAERGLRQLGDTTARTGKRFTGLKVAGAAALAAVAVGAAKFGAASVKAYVEAEASQIKLQAAYEKFPKIADVSLSSLTKLNSALALKTKYDDDATASGQAVLAQFNLTGKQITELTPLLQDYASRTGKDLPTAAKDLGKAVMGQGRALKNVGLNLKDTGTQTGNLNQLMKGLRTQVGGFAEKEGKSAAGQFEILKNQGGEIQEEFGEKMLPALLKVGKGLLQILTYVQDTNGVFGSFKRITVAAFDAFTESLGLGEVSFRDFAQFMEEHQGDIVLGFVAAGEVTIAFGEAISIMASVALRGFGLIMDSMGDMTSLFLRTARSLVHGAALAFGWIPGVGERLKRADKAFDDFSNTAIDGLHGAGKGARAAADGIDNKLRPALTKAGQKLDEVGRKEIVKAKTREDVAKGTEAVKTYTEAVKGVPGAVKTKVTQPGMPTSLRDSQTLDRYINNLNDKDVDITYRTNAGRLAEAFKLGLTLNSGEQKGGSVAQVGNQAGGPALTFSHGHGPESGGPGIQRTISAPVHGRPNAPRFDTLTNRLARGVGNQLGRRIGAKLDDMGAASGAPGGSIATRSGGLQAAMAAMRAQGARSFTTYPGHHPSMARARDVTPHSWAIANAARAMKGIWYVIYRMKIASKNHGNVWRQYRPTNFRGDWRHVRHVHIASYDRGGTLRPGLTLAVNNTGRNEYVRGPGRGGGGDNYYVTVNAPQYVGDKKDLANAMYSLAVEGRLNAPLRKAGVRV